MPAPISTNKPESKRTESSHDSGGTSYLGVLFLLLTILAGVAYFTKKLSKNKVPELPKQETPKIEDKVEESKQETLENSERDKISSKFGDFN